MPGPTRRALVACEKAPGDPRCHHPRPLGGLDDWTLAEAREAWYFGPEGEPVGASRCVSTPVECSDRR